MTSAWRLDEHNPYEDGFEEALLSELTERHLSDIVLRALHQIARNPLQGEKRMIDGTPVYVVNTRSHPTVGGAGLLIAYVVEPDRSLIRPLLLQRSENELTDETLRKAIEGSSHSDDQASQRVLFPEEPTRIPAKSIENAVKRVMKRSK
jgi:hypothetical protein